MSELRNIAILVESSRAFGRGLIHGITDYAARRRDWQFHFQESSLAQTSLNWIFRSRIDGILARITSAEMAEALAASGIPTVDILGEFPCAGIPRVMCDNAAVSRAALDLFVSSGFDRIGFCGYPGILYSDLRQSALIEASAAKGIEVSVYDPGTRGTDISHREAWHPKRQDTLALWLDSLPKPVGILCANDIRALDLSAVCREEGIPVPQDVAILGVDDDRLICEMAHPHNSSVEPDTHRQGFIAADLLQSLLDGSPAPALPILAGAKSLVERASTDRVVTSFPHVAIAFRYLRAHLAEAIGAEQVAAHAGVSRSLLDRDFKQALGRTVSEELRKLRLIRICHLLIHGRENLEEIARQTGFSGKTALSNFFKAHTGTSPGSYRIARSLPAPAEKREPSCQTDE
jgi:LacI family transcriptional regulator